LIVITFCSDLKKNNNLKSRCQWLTPVMLATLVEAETRGIMVGGQPGQIVPEILSQKYSRYKKVGVVVQVVECLFCK
jgi:hypothetical protein